jgi:hypothetical protein
MKNVTGRLNHLSEAGQIAVEDLKKNPFMRETPATERADSPTRKQFIEEQTRKEAAGFELWSITASSRDVCCMVNDKVLRLGDKINGFTVKKIEAHTVTIERDGVSVELKMN